ncbi:MAG TPA: helix-turn-helix transcriptional regulator [Gammaproteobacteria bacterium]|nr:helix-turn-helix transcriptional regulator [Gammaproteobacteria bacterium]
MSAHMKMRHTKINKPILCVSEQGQVYKLPQSVLNRYVVNDNLSIKKAKNNVSHSLGVTPEEAFAEINAKYTKTGALLKAVRLREGLNQKDFAALINVTQGDLSKMEHGKRPVGKILTRRIAKKFKSKIS